MTEPELRKLALDIVEGKVFGSWMIPEADQDRLLPVVFMPLSLRPVVTQKLLEESQAASLYEYYDKGKMGINGYPNFMSCCFLTKEEVDQIGPMVKQLQTMRLEFLDGNQSRKEPK